MTDNDLIAELRAKAEPRYSGPYSHPELHTMAADALERLEAWKAEAIIVLDEWDNVWEAAGRPGPLGTSKAAAVLTHIQARDPPRRLRRDWIDALAYVVDSADTGDPRCTTAAPLVEALDDLRRDFVDSLAADYTRRRTKPR